MIPTDVFVVNWAGWAAVAAALVLTVTTGRGARWSRPGGRWLLAACLMVFTAELVNLYTRVPWGSFLFYVTIPFWITALVVRIRSWRREGRGTAGRHGGRGRQPGDAPDEAWPPGAGESWPAGPGESWPQGPGQSWPPGPGAARPPGPGGPPPAAPGRAPDWYG